MPTKKIFACLLVSVISLTLFGCAEETETDVVLPDIVFVKFFHYPIEREYNGGKFIGTSGYFIEKNGTIKYFEFEDESEPVFEKPTITVNEYSDLRNISEFHEKLFEIGVDTELEAIPEEDLISCYKSLMKINGKNKLEFESSHICLVYGLEVLYGVTLNDNNEEKYILINEEGDSYYINENRHAKELNEKLKSIFPDLYQ